MNQFSGQIESASPVCCSLRTLTDPLVLHRVSHTPWQFLESTSSGTVKTCEHRSFPLPTDASTKTLPTDDEDQSPRDLTNVPLAGYMQSAARSRQCKASCLALLRFEEGLAQHHLEDATLGAQLRNGQVPAFPRQTTHSQRATESSPFVLVAAT